MKENPIPAQVSNIDRSRLTSRRSFLRRIPPWLLLPVLTMVITDSAIPLRRYTGTEPYEFTIGNDSFIFFGGVHGTDLQDPLNLGEKLRLPEGEINLTGLFLEDTGFSYLDFFRDDIPQSRQENIIQVILKAQEEVPFTQNFVRYAKGENVPFLYAEIPSRDKADVLGYLGGFTPISAVMIGGAFFASERSSRREFLKKSFATAIGIWGYSNMLKNFSVVVLPEIMRKPWAKELRTLASFAEFSHPEDILEVFRNALISEKLLWYSEIQRKEMDRDSNIGLAMGLGHEYISEYLQRGREFCQHILNLYPDNFLEWVFGENFQLYYPKLLELKPDGSFRILTDPELQKRIEQ